MAFFTVTGMVVWGAVALAALALVVLLLVHSVQSAMFAARIVAAYRLQDVPVKWRYLPRWWWSGFTSSGGVWTIYPRGMQHWGVPVYWPGVKPSPEPEMEEV